MLTPTPWHHHVAGTGQIHGAVPQLHLRLDGASSHAYSNAQLDDYQRGGQPALVRHPPLTLRLRARFSHPAGLLRGTMGFGLWNYPLVLPPALPRALWFFYQSPPGNLPLALGVPGAGCWKAATIDTGRTRALALLPFAPLVVPLLHQPRLFQGLWPPIQWAVGVSEARVQVPMETWHDYVIEWGHTTSRFLVDGRIVLENAPSPRGPLCTVIWVDNQYLVLTPQGQVAWGLLDVAGPQWLAVERLELCVS
ncbi:hypothetical protein [Candidatus Viridilinea mediisalina]|uniref:GH16 domain-containing protein n=1 Tax=Candidatus Viridilinea mediisalina TaxID=2024553 RepID=A0A2A6RF03_9CHLR|nr:hypothetical protein [Candidatus Viridilinea mediisalina]PDW01466.1 hypothetical protein CJ255_18980 [Candidatus Viridilinea mediisalina]